MTVPVVVDLWADVVRTVQDSRTDHRKGDRRDQRRRRTRQGRRRREPPGRPGLRRSNRSRRSSRARTARSSTPSSARCPSPRCASSWSDSRPGRPMSTSWSTPATRRRCARRSSSTRPTSTPPSRSATCCVADDRLDEADAVPGAVRERGRRQNRARADPTPAKRRLPRRRPRSHPGAPARAVLDDAERQGLLLEILDALGPEDPRYVSYRRKLASRLY